MKCKNKNNKRMLCAKNQRKPSKRTIAKFYKINDILSTYDDLQLDMQISSLCATLELGYV